MRMILHAVDDDRLLSLVLDDPRHVFERLLPPFFLEEVLAPLHGEDDLNVDLGICACHDCLRWLRIMSSLRDLIHEFLRV